MLNGFSSFLEDTIFGMMADQDEEDLQSYDESLVTSVLETCPECDKIDEDECEDIEDYTDWDEDDDDDFGYYDDDDDNEYSNSVYDIYGNSRTYF